MEYKNELKRFIYKYINYVLLIKTIIDLVWFNIWINNIRNSTYWVNMVDIAYDISGSAQRIYSDSINCYNQIIFYNIIFLILSLINLYIYFKFKDRKVIKYIFILLFIIEVAFIIVMNVNVQYIVSNRKY